MTEETHTSLSAFDLYVDPIAQRYASKTMQALFSPMHRARVWRDLWIVLAEAEHELGLPVTAAQVRELREQRDAIDLERVAEHEKQLRHDVMAHIHAYGEVAPGARGIIHLGATSCFVTDNADLIILRRGLDLVSDRLLRSIHALARFCRENAHRPALGLTHLQPAQLTTVGKRAALWLQDLVDVWHELDDIRGRLPLRGVKGTTGTQASFLHLFDGDAAKVAELERRVAEKVGFSKVFPLTGQTYPRVWDQRVIGRLGELGTVVHKAATDLRLLQSFGEVEEPYEKSQVGSSAMPYKRNPMRSERLCSLARHLLSIPPGLATLAATQWMERTLDDSAHRRVAIPQAFLTCDAILITLENVFAGMTVVPRVVERRVAEHLPFMAAEEILMGAVSEGGDRQELHERIRQLSWQAKQQLVESGGENPLRAMLEADEVLGPVVSALPAWDPARFVGLAPQQTIAYLEGAVADLPAPAELPPAELSV
ncbi:MAG: adenylosuccinate lyase [Planctomycetota bacterium]|jgi:adenylosuccinate lyase